ncbi:acyl homoserine lactone synthase [Paraburkholderia sp. BL23I1N1]|uniref:acyl-homoserine-lactone synthase n=1 Tax=Paraburkholderia sp. BL23I1N1 TaxID=1938802 RepID=UPI000E756AB3|nr:acyl-homoserine-lactone synthase [Paraburkholderia sp. BL23I1N1]RKE39526.1 acyl homoserine lactone synthase [Paraburkholderia sp. BL23I1N1]
MSFIVAGRLADLPSDICRNLGTFRHKVFVQRLHWEIPGVSHDATSEWDEFDGGHTIHLVALSADDEVCGCARLMPTIGPYLLRDVFPQLAGPGLLPSSTSIWEMSRFAGSGLPDHRTGSTSGMSLFPYAMALAFSFGATRVIGVVSRSVARLYRRFGLDLHDIGAGTAPGRADIVACSIDLGPATFRNLLCDPSALLDSITRFGQIPFPEAGLRGHSSSTDAGTRSAYAPGDEHLAVCDNETMHPQATV